MEPIYMWLIGGAVVIVIAGAVAVYFTGRKKKPVEVPAAGELSRTQQIQALEGALGIPPSMRLDAAQSTAAEPTVPMSVHLAAVQRLTRTPAQLTRELVAMPSPVAAEVVKAPVDAGPSDPHKDAMAAIRVRLLEIMKG